MSIESLIQSAIALLPIFLFGCIGEIIMEKSGHLNLGVPGIMCAGTAGGCLGVTLYFNNAQNVANPSYVLLVLFAIFFALLFAMVVGLIYGFLTVSLRCNQNITGLAITTFGVGFTETFIDSILKVSQNDNFHKAYILMSKSLPFADKLGAFGNMFLSHNIFIYLSIAVAVVTALVLNKTKCGLRLRAIGENPSSADAVGINVTRYKYIAIAVGSAIAGLGGLFFVMCYAKEWENASTIEAYGWLCVALVIFTVWKPNLSILGAILFGALSAMPYLLPAQIKSQKELIKLLPYVFTVIVLIFTSVFDSKNAQPPASLGINYFREER